jgi:hypothetical protein
MSNYKCAACGVGNVAPVARAGRVWRYKQLDLEVPATLVVRTCDNCGEEYIRPSEAKAFDAAMEPVYRETVREKLVAALLALEPVGPMTRIERALHLSEGYLSKLKLGRAEASPSLVSSLGLLAANPQSLVVLEAMWSAGATSPEASGFVDHWGIRLGSKANPKRKALMPALAAGRPAKKVRKAAPKDRRAGT